MLKEAQIIKKLSKFKVLCACAKCNGTYECGYYDALKSRIGHLCAPCKNRIVNMDKFSQPDLLEVFIYDEHTGELRHRLDTLKGASGDLATYAHSQGYLSVSIGGKEYLAHRIIWMMKTGKWPDQVDHGDHKRSNNRWVNLKEVVSRVNQLNLSKKINNSSGVTGVRVLPSGKFNAYIMVHRKQIALGSYVTIGEATLARKSAEQRYGFHTNHGS